MHSYDGDFAQRLPGVLSIARQYGKRVFVQAFGASGSGKASSLCSQIQAIQNKPGRAVDGVAGGRALPAVPVGTRGSSCLVGRSNGRLCAKTLRLRAPAGEQAQQLQRL